VEVEQLQRGPRSGVGGEGRVAARLRLGVGLGRDVDEVLDLVVGEARQAAEVPRQVDGFSSSSPRKPPKLKSLSTARWNARAPLRRSGSSSVMRRSQSEPIFTWVTSSASIQSSQKNSTGSCVVSPNSRMVLNTSMARPSSARLTPVRRRTGSALQPAS
jgi:hypothetical protein